MWPPISFHTFILLGKALVVLGPVTSHAGSLSVGKKGPSADKIIEKEEAIKLWN